MKLSLLSAAMVIAASSAMAQHAHQSGSSPSETGQSQFAAIAEVVTILRNDKDTDWTNVDIQALRDHLVDMDNVTTSASVAMTVDDMTVRFSVSGDGTVAASIKRMVLAHSPMLQQATDWTVVASEQPNGAIMIIEAASPEELDQIVGLGFFGVMTIGAHHQGHHLMIASGRSPH